jgi:hypothetical protein
MQAPSSYQQQQPQPQQQQHHQQQQQTSYEQKCLDITTKSLSGLESLVDQIPSIAEAEANGSGAVGPDPSIPHSQSLPHALSSTPSSMPHGGHFGESSSGFLPYGHHVPPSTYAAASHYASSPYYASELSSSFPVNPLTSAYSPSPSIFGYPGYHGQYHSATTMSGAGGYGPSSSSSLHLTHSSYGNPGGYSSSAYSGPNPYMQAHSMSSTPSGMPGSQRYPQRPFPNGMDLGSLGFGGF